MLLLSSCRPMITNARSWHKADMLAELDARFERSADIADSILYESTGSRSLKKNATVNKHGQYRCY